MYWNTPLLYSKATVNLTLPLPWNPNQTIRVDELEAVLTLPAINDTCSTSLSALPMV